MIFYFSATGNCKYVATRIASATNDITVSITDCLKTNTFDFNLKHHENIGFVTPTYFWGLPTVVIDFLEQLKIKMNGKHYVYHIITYGTINGQTHYMMSNYLKKICLSLDGKFIVKMVDTWTPIFNLTDKDENQKKLANAEREIDTIIEYVNDKIKGDYNNRKGHFANLVYAIYKYGRKTKKFTVGNSCIECGLCEKQCPVLAIKTDNGKPKWIKKQCTLCLGCLHRCPKFSIQYGNKTKNHGQYVNPNVKL
ncbi:MAG: EFR1 family ferrodoxin [Oscillospiraceae bacterium]|jgi:NAD-dependent dihydropyrimidine dehydrogenase PreA subunit/flavodoxin|nr:EFR1 family ferrodoxin [Oscillospiraceae bacterium]